MSIFKTLLGKKRPTKDVSERKEAPLSIRREEALDDRIIGYQYDVTGSFGYFFYRGFEKLCAVTSPVLPEPPVMIDGLNMEWESPYEDGTVVPGLTRTVWDTQKDCEAFRLVYRGESAYDLEFPEERKEIQVYCSSEWLLFTQDEKVVARITRTQDDTLKPMEGMKPFFAAEFMREDPKFMLAVLAFPMLRIGV